MTSPVGWGRVGAGSYRFGLALAVVAFGGYFVLIALGDLFPLEHFGAGFLTTPQTTTVTSIDPAGPAGRAGLRVGDEIVSVDGFPARNALDWASAFTRVETGHPMPVVVRRNGQTEPLSAVFQRRAERFWENREQLFIVLARVAQLITLLFAIAIGVRATGRREVLGFWLLATISIYSVGLPPRMAVFWRAVPLPLEPLLFVPSISKVAIGFILFTFFCALVNVRLGFGRLVLIGAPFVAIVIWDVVFLVALLYVPAWVPHLTGFLPLVIGTNFSYVLAALVMLGIHYRTLRDPTDRRRLRWIVAGSALGCAAGAPTVAGLWLGIGDDPTLIYHTPLWLQLVYMAFLLMPASFWWAIARGELFDLRFVVRRGLQYVFARRGLLVITPVIVAALLGEAALHENESFREILRTHAWVYYGTAAGLIVFRRRRAMWLDALDRRLFRERFDAVQLLRDVVARIRTSRDLRTAAEYAVTQIDAALHPEWVAVFAGALADSSLTVLAGDPPCATWPPPPFDELDVERSGARLVAPAASESAGMETLFVLGAKRSGEPYSKEDKNLVHAIAESVDHLAVTLAAEHDADAFASGHAAWDKHLWSLADAVATGSRVDWAKESTEIQADEGRQVLLELQALERLMQVHGAPSDQAPHDEGANAAGRKWGDFELREPLGGGRFGTVFRAWDPQLEREVAVKLLTVAGVDRSAYLREARHLARVRHPNVVHVYGADERDDLPGFWMELIEGRTLADDLRDRGPFSAEETSHVASVLCRALSAVHRAGLVHQDVKAQNVMREPDGRLVLMDLGAVSIGPNRPYWGTPKYMAPELFKGAVASPQSDIYSLGVLLFVLATGEFPIDGKTSEEIAERHVRGERRRLRDVRPEFPAGVADAIDRAMDVDLTRRYFSADELSGAMTAAEVS